MNWRKFGAAAFVLLAASCGPRNDATEIAGGPSPKEAAPPLGVDSGTARGAPSDSATDPFWRNAVIYFLLTDRFANGDEANDGAYGRVKDGDTLRSFMGGDIKGVIGKLEDGYFNDLGVTAIWTTPVIEQVHSPYQEFGRSYAFHGYWPRDWTRVDGAFGEEADFAKMVEVAHSQGIGVVVDVIMNHAGPVTESDPAWPAEWVRTNPVCDWRSYSGVATCLIVPTLRDIRTESEEPVALPAFLVDKWRAEGRLDVEVAELDAFFERTGYPRAPKYYIIKWLTDWVREYGVDGFRADTAKHVDPEAWAILKKEADQAFVEWKSANPEKVLDDRGFYMVGEIFNYGVAGFENAPDGSRLFDYGDRQVDFYDFGFDALINMGFATHAKSPMPDLFQLYADELSGPFKGKGVLNYLASHDDMEPIDPERKNAFENAIKLLLAPGGAQIYYGDELGRTLNAEGATGDAKLRSLMNWEALETAEGRALFDHWRKLAAFRKAHPAVGAGSHREIQRTPYVFARILNENGDADAVLVAVGGEAPLTSIPTAGVFADGATLHDAYSGETVTVDQGRVVFASPREIALLSMATEGARPR